jgi:Cu+-exporting ATPase
MAMQLVKDPVCGMDVDPTDAPGGMSEFKGERYYFCAAGCKVAFDKEPQRYLAPDFVPSGMPDDRPKRRWWEFWK